MSSGRNNSTTFEQAVERVIELRPDIVILDWTMPVMNGLQAAQMIRSFAPETKIIVFSLHDGNTVSEEALRAGADVFLHKTAVSLPGDFYSRIQSLARFLRPMCPSPAMSPAEKWL